MSLLEGKKALVIGTANERSLAWGIVKALSKNGAKIGMTYLNDSLKSRVAPLAEEIGAEVVEKLDVNNLEDYAQLKKVIVDKWGGIDILVHSVAFANRDDLKGKFIDTSREGFLTALDVSAFSLVQVCKQFQDLLSSGSSVMTLTYHGSTQVIKNYNVMGVAKAALEASVRYLALDLGEQNIRINAISAGPVKTLSASGVSGFRQILSTVEEKAALKRNIDQNDVGGMGVYLGSDLSNSVTGQVYYVDAGLSIIGVS